MKKKLHLLILALLSVFLFISCGGSKETTGAKAATKDTLVVANGADAKSLDPHATNDAPSSKVTVQIYDRLVEQDENMNIIPSLAESWEQPDDVTTVFHLRKGVKFHNGYDFTAEDVKFSFERMANSPRIAFVLPPIEKVEVVDDYTVNIVTKTPFGPLLAHLSHPALGIVSKKLLTEDEQSFKDHPIGTGSYKFKEWVPGDSLTLEKNEDYFDKKNGLKYIVFKNIVEASNRTIGLETGEIDISISVSSVDENTIKNNPKLQLITKPSISYSYVGMNTQKTPLNDVRVRKAIAMGVNRDIIIDSVLMGAVEKANSLLGPGVVGYSKDTKPFEYNPEEAKRLLNEAGYETLDLVMVTSNNDLRKQMAEIMQAQLKEIGINIKIEILEWATFLNTTGSGKSDLFMIGWSNSSGDADYGLTPMLHSSMKGNSGNRSSLTIKNLIHY